MLLMYETVVRIDEKETNNEIILFYSHLINSRESQTLLLKYLDYVVSALMCSVSKEGGQLHEKVKLNNF